jgi:serine/threonine-protein kinase
VNQHPKNAAAGSDGLSAAASSVHPHMALVEGSQPDLSCEIRDLATDHLRSASLLLCAAYAAFFVRSLFVLDQFATAVDWLQFTAHFTIMVITGLVGVRLWCGCAHTRQHYRIAEVAVFGGSAAFMVLINYNALVQCAKLGHPAPIVIPWLVLIFTYALYIPNGWRRATAVIVPMALCPPIVLLIAALTSPEVRDVLQSHSRFEGGLAETLLVMTLATAISVWGAGRMSELRTEAFEAQRLGQYRLKERLGGGGMGDVYLAEHVLLKRPCAVKVIRPEKAGDPQLLARFEREVRSTARLTHWNSVEIFDYGRADDGTFYYVMELLPGMNLDQIVREHGPLPAERVIHFLEQTCDALAEAHALGLVHRDIKPANIFAAQRGGLYDVTKLLDFGLVRSLHQRDEAELHLTQTGSVTGSPQYLSPEQAVGDALDGRTDIYSLGAVGWFLLTGRPPFVAQNPIKVILAHAHQPVEPPSQHAEDVPPDLEAVILRCLAKRPGERYQTVQELRRALLACRDAGQWTRESAAAWWQGRDASDGSVGIRIRDVDAALAATVV